MLAPKLNYGLPSGKGNFLVFSIGKHVLIRAKSEQVHFLVFLKVKPVFIRAKSEHVHFLVFSSGKACALLGLRVNKFIL